MQKTIKDAVKMLPPQYREVVEEIWEETQCADIYNGELSKYFDVILTVLEFRTKQKDGLREKLDRIKEIID